MFKPDPIVVMFTASGLLVRFLKVFEKSNYQSVKWVRYMTKANSTYQIRVSPTQRIISSYSRPDLDHYLHTPVLAIGIAVRDGSVLSNCIPIMTITLRPLFYMSEAKATDDDERQSRRLVSSNLISVVAIENFDVAQSDGIRYVRVSQVSEVLRGLNCDRRIAGCRSVFCFCFDAINLFAFCDGGWRSATGRSADGDLSSNE